MQSDNQLVRKIKRKQNREAADILVERYYKEIYGFTYRQTGDMELSMDLTQEIFITILQGIHTFEERKASFRTGHIMWQPIKLRIITGVLLRRNGKWKFCFS